MRTPAGRTLPLLALIVSAAACGGAAGHASEPAPAIGTAGATATESSAVGDATVGARAGAPGRPCAANVGDLHRASGRGRRKGLSGRGGAPGATQRRAPSQVRVY
jgi:hypothetical protein